jgi:hypothetical protein
MKKKIIITCCSLVAIFAVGASFQVARAENASVQENMEALADDKKFPAGTCDGTGPGFTDVKCPGGYVICCWAHTHVYGK